MALTITPGYTWKNGEPPTATKLNLTAVPTIADGQSYTFGTITTAAPAGGSGAGVWKLGTRVSGTYTLDSTKAVEIDIGGTLIRLAVLI